MNLIIILILYAIVFVISEITYRKFNAPFLLSRKIAHITGSFVSFLLPYFIVKNEAIIIGLIFTVIIYLSKKKYLFEGIHDKKANNIGEVLFPFGIILSVLFIWPLSIVAYQGSCLVLGLSDGFAGYIGSKYGKKKYSIFGGEKTIEGSAVFLISTLIILTFYYCLFSNDLSILGILMLIIYTICITLIESILSYGFDNLLIPVTAGLALLLLIS